MEACDGLDNNCDGVTDEGCATYYQDADGDTYGNPNVYQTFAAPGFVADNTDCDDTDPLINPGAAEIMSDGIDQDCDGNDSAGPQKRFFEDVDNDSFGTANFIMDVAATAPFTASQAGDCNDADPAINPGVPETCDGIDNNCDGIVDDGCAKYYEDNDGDNYGTGNYQMFPGGVFTAALTGDCDDANNAVHPGALEACDGIDNNCDGVTDEGCAAYYQDADGDTYGNPNVYQTFAAAGYVADNTDCNDGDGAINPGAGEACDGIDNNCDGIVDEGCPKYYEDNDGDNYGTGNYQIFPGGVFTAALTGDCDDANNAVHPGALEACDGIDNNCDGVTDEGCVTYYQDADGDTYGNPNVYQTFAAAGFVADNTDCNDGDGTINPGAGEACDGFDNNCDGIVDEGCPKYYEDNDGDNYGTGNYQMFPSGVFTAALTGDCDDANNAVHPGAAEGCDGFDNNCDGVTDEGCATYYQDADSDTFGDPNVYQTFAAPGFVADNTDCNDADPAINPGAGEACDGIDNNCDGIVDEGCAKFYEDADGDGYGTDNFQLVSGGAFTAALTGDCNDADPAINPGAAEGCDGFDNNCDGVMDEGCSLWYQDIDGDNYGNPTVFQTFVVAGYVADNTDCNDADAAINPGAGEACDGIDNNCDGVIDAGCPKMYEDADGDGYGTGNYQMFAGGAFTAALTGDCNDADLAINPGVAEVCDGFDNNCDGVADEGCALWYQDIDGDSYGNPNVSQTFAVGGYVADNTDCNDGDAAINPGVPETCDGFDNNCNGIVDEGCAKFYEDTDGDGYGTGNYQMFAGGAFTAALTGDCNDTDPAVNPGMAEGCDGFDNNCDGVIDAGCAKWYQDADGDTYGNPNIYQTFAAAGYVADGTDCDDGNAAINPGAAEVCGDGIDNNCAGGVDDGCLTWYQDVDGDNYGDDSVTSPTWLAGYVSDDTDCDDANDLVHPGATELCEDGIDNDCDGDTDEGCRTWYPDLDGDLYGSAASSVVAIVKPADHVADNTDCNDGDAAINPGATEACDGVDNNCNGVVDEGCVKWYPDSDGDGFGDSATFVVADTAPPGHVSRPGDCDDADAAIHPFVEDICDDIDNDCDGFVEEDVPPADFKNYYRDADGDGFGNTHSYLWRCRQPVGYVAIDGDCDDNQAAYYPGAFDICGNGIDEDCNGVDRACGVATDTQCADIADAPLETIVDAPPPIVMMVLDNSGSMGWDIMCPGEDDGLYNGASDCRSVDEWWETQWSEVNNIYYNPTVEYTPWPGYPDANTTRPRQHPDGATTTDLDARFGTIDNSNSYSIKYAHYYTWSSSQQRPYLVIINSNSVEYYRIAAGQKELDRVHFSGRPTYHEGLATADVPDDVIVSQAWDDGNRECSATEAAAARQNFANWYQYYRTRMLTANNTLAKVVSGVSGVQIGVATINVNSASGFQTPLLVDNEVSGGHDGPANRQEIIDFIFSAGRPSGGTPLRKTFKDIGDFLDDSASDSRPSPWASLADGGECQMAFIIVMTDGYYNGSAPNIGDRDGDANTDFDGVPFAECGGCSYYRGCETENTLGDIAMMFYERDLAPGLPDHVPTTSIDTAPHQHAVTYSISFGVTGTLNPKAYNEWASSSNCASAAGCTAETPCDCVPRWPEVPDTTSGCLEKIDDLYHAAFNGRGEYFAAANVQQLTYALTSIMNAITSRRGQGASVAVNTQTLEEDALLFLGTYNSANWSGDLTSWVVAKSTGSVASNYTWSAAEKLDARDLATDPRKVFTYRPDTGNGVTFDLANLSAEQQAMLGSDAVDQQRLIDYIKGDTSQEIKHGGVLRSRDSRLGDIIHSAPVHVISGANDYIYVGGNDGMLHVFDASAGGGNEVFAYIPSQVMERLSFLIEPTYNHKYYVDTTVFVDYYDLLVGGLGAGGKGYFALDVSSPDTFGVGDVLWEFPDGVDSDMGFSFAKPVIYEHTSGRLVILGNGYDSDNGRAVLYVLRVDANGAIVETTKIDTGVGVQSGSSANQTGCNGLSSPVLLDEDFNNSLDYVYAGDLQGNLWKFDLTGATLSDFKVAYHDPADPAVPRPLFQANYNGTPQPITTKPGIMGHCLTNRSGYILVFGTGKYFANHDFQDTSVQTIYGVWDWAEELEDGGVADPEAYPLGIFDRPAGASVPIAMTGVTDGVTNPFRLLQQTAGALSGKYRITSDFKLFDKENPDPNGDGDTSDAQMGWFDADLWADPNITPYPGGRYVGWYYDMPNSGERNIADASIRAGLAIMVSVDPSPTPCQPGGNSILQFFQACDGSRPIEEVLDFNEDGEVNEEDFDVNWMELDDIYFTPVIIEDKLFFTNKDPLAGPSEKLGVSYWRFLNTLH